MIFLQGFGNGAEVKLIEYGNLKSIPIFSIIWIKAKIQKILNNCAIYKLLEALSITNISRCSLPEL